MYSYTDETDTDWLIVPSRNKSLLYAGQKIPNFALDAVFLVTGWMSWVSQMLVVVGVQMSDGRLAALIGMLRPKSRIASSPPLHATYVMKSQ